MTSIYVLKMEKSLNKQTGNFTLLVFFLTTGFDVTIHSAVIILIIGLKLHWMVLHCGREPSHSSPGHATSFFGRNLVSHNCNFSDPASWQ